MELLIETIDVILLILFQVFKFTWWIVLPIFLLSKVVPLYLHHKKIEYSKKMDWVLLEVNLPPEVTKTPKAMENVLEGLHGVWSPPTTRDRWTEGTVVDKFSLEIVGTDGNLHFYVRCQRKQRKFVESKIFSQYHDAEVTEVADYTEAMPMDIPNKDYDIWGADYILNKDWAYPLRTYVEFEDIDEDRRMDPLSQLAELVSKLEPGEHIWLQMIISPVLTEKGDNAGKVINEMAGQKPKPYTDPLTSFFNAFSGGGAAQAPKEDSGGLQKLTPGKRAALEKIELKDSKSGYNTMIRGMYIARKDVWSSQYIAGLQGFLRQFSGLNSFRPDPETFPKGSFILFKNQRNYMRKRKLFLAYKGRYLGFKSSPYVLNVEEIATMFHFPGSVVHAPFMPRVPSRTSEPPRGLPT